MAEQKRTPKKQSPSPPPSGAEGAAASGEPLFSLDVHEIKQIGTAADPWVTLPVPAGTSASKKNGRVVLSVVYGAPQRIPARGHYVLKMVGAPVLRFEFGGIPTVRSKTIDTDPMPQEIAAMAAEFGRPIGLCRTAMPSAPAEIEADFPGYGALPEEKWVQLNPTTELYVVQLKLRKMAPVDVHRDLGAGLFYVYGVERLVLHVAAPVEIPAAPQTDREKVLAI